MLVTHRVVEANYEESEFITKGDANKTEDPLPVSYKNVVGKVFMGVPYIGATVRFISDDKNKTDSYCNACFYWCFVNRLGYC